MSGEEYDYLTFTDPSEVAKDIARIKVGGSPMQDEVKALAEKLLAALDSFEMEWEWTPTLLDGEIVGYKSVKPSEQGMRNLTDYLARVALEYVEGRITESVNAYIRAINKMYAIEAEKIITGEVKFEIKEQP